jgi:redox-sensitive bicupin YhaK (pirin superfamily)
MSWLPCDDPRPEAQSAASAVETLIVGRARDLGGFEVRRLLPSPLRQMVGPFIFFDEMGPADFAPGTGIDVRPHPHIGLATVTYLFDGEILHRDSLGTVQPIRPGDVNWMTAGHGIVHSERTGPEARAQGGRLAGIQAWVALPHDKEEVAPAFVHHPGERLPLLRENAFSMRLIAGSFLGARSPVETAWDTLYADVVLSAEGCLPIGCAHEERAVYVVSGAVRLDGHRAEAGQFVVLRPGREINAVADAPVRMMLLGGAAMDGPRHLWWNFVSSSRARIEQAKADWKGGRFPRVPGDDAFIPLPEG